MFFFRCGKIGKKSDFTQLSVILSCTKNQLKSLSAIVMVYRELILICTQHHQRTGLQYLDTFGFGLLKKYGVLGSRIKNYPFRR